MPEFFVQKNGHQFGPFDENTIRREIDAGRFSGEDSGWLPGRADWQPLHELFDLDTTKPPPIITAPAPQRSAGTGLVRKRWILPFSIAVVIIAVLTGLLFVPAVLAPKTPPPLPPASSEEDIDARIARTDFSPDQIREVFKESVFEVRCEWKEKGGFLWLSTVTGGCQGSAVMLANDEHTGWLLTNRHVIQAPDASWGFACVVRTTAKPYDIPAKVAAIRKDGIDLAVLTINLPPGAQPGHLGVLRAAQIKEGQSCVAIGNALGGGLSVTSGLVSRLDQNGGVVRIRTSAPVNPGNSGGPLFATRGAKLIGIVSSGMGAGEAQNVNWAVPIDYALDPESWIDEHGNRPQLYFGPKEQR
jgi:S1-C subfamily serine protease